MQGGQLRKLSAVQYRLKIIMITLNNSRDENEQKWLISSVWKKWDKRLGRCSATLMVGYLCCKSYYVCALVCIFAIFSCFFFASPHLILLMPFFLPISTSLSSIVIRLFYCTSHYTQSLIWFQCCGIRILNLIFDIKTISVLFSMNSPKAMMTTAATVVVSLWGIAEYYILL